VLGAQSAPGEPPRLERVRENLRARPEAERARLERNLESFRRLAPDARAELLARAQVLRERERTFDAVVSERLRARGVAPESPEAEELVGRWLRERLREHGRELRERLPKEVRRRLEHAPPDVRRRYVDRLLKEREVVARKALARQRVRLELPPGEVGQLAGLPVAERLRALRELERERDGG
jgi:hypothetical protein